MDLPDLADEDLDLALRHLTRQFPLQLARALLSPGARITAADWTDTQITSRQRRLDRALEVVADGARCFEHLEVQHRMRRDVPFRVFEYQALLALALVAATPKGKVVPPIHSTVVLLTGRRAPWPERGEYRLSPPGLPFSGVSFRIDAVYQRTVAELSARGSPLWLVFAPLAVDADPQRMKEVLAKLRAETTEREFAELAVALTVVAAKDGRRRGLREVILGLLKEDDVMRSAVFEWGLRRGKDVGKLEGEQQTVACLFEQRLGRALDEGERTVLVRRLDALGVGGLIKLGVDLAPEALAAWLREPDAA